jgi:hypothetical protein
VGYRVGMIAQDIMYYYTQAITRAVNLAVFLTAAFVAFFRLLAYHRGALELDAFDWPLGIVFACVMIEIGFRAAEHYWQPSERRGFPVERKDK